MVHKKESDRSKSLQSDVGPSGDRSRTFNLLKKALARRRIAALVILSIIVLAVICALWVVLHRTQTDTNASSSLCQYKKTSPIYDKSVKAMQTNNQESLKKVVEEIKQQENYKKDPNCLYPIIYNNLQYADVKSAESNYQLLKKSYDTKRGMAKTYQFLGVSSVNDINQWMKQQRLFYSKPSTSIIGIPEVKNK